MSNNGDDLTPVPLGMNGADTSRTDDFTNSAFTFEPEVPTTPKTVVSFVLGEEDKKDPNVQIKKESDAQKGYSRGILLGVLYALMLILLGICFPVAEAIIDKWYTHHVVAVFMTYLFAISVIFLVYLQIILSRRKWKDDQSAQSTTNESPASISAISKRTPKGSSFDDLDILDEEDETDGGSSPNINTQRASYGNSRMRSNRSYEGGGYQRRSSLSEISLDDMPVKTRYKRKRRASDAVSLASIRTVDVEEGGRFNPAEEEVQEYINVITQTASVAHEGTSFYLRLGCLIFAMANLVYVGLEIQYQDVMSKREECVDKRQINYPFYLHLIFILVQTFFLFKNCMITVGKRQKMLVRFGLAHNVATNLCVWLRILVREVMEGIHQGKPHAAITADPPDDNKTVCVDDTILHSASPYLFPFVLEYSLIALATYSAMFTSLDLAISKDVLTAVKKAIYKSKKGQSKKLGENDSHHSHHSSEDMFAKAHVGLFVGVVVLAGMVISMLLFYFLQGDGSDNTPAIIFHTTDITVDVIMAIAITIGIAKFFRLAFSLTRSNTIDHALLLVSLAGSIVFEVFAMISTFDFIIWGNEYESSGSDLRTIAILSNTGSLTSIVNGVLQSIFIIDGMQRYSDKADDRKRKPGRGAITFLIITNVGLWIFKSFQIKQLSFDNQVDFYGYIAWPIILNVTLPLIVFLHFHSSVCLADMWHAAYEAEDEMPFDIQYLN